MRDVALTRTRRRDGHFAELSQTHEPTDLEDRLFHPVLQITNSFARGGILVPNVSSFWRQTDSQTDRQTNKRTDRQHQCTKLLSLSRAAA